MGKQFGFLYICFGFISVNRISRFYDTGKCFRPYISHGVKRPCLHPWNETLDFRIFYSSFGTTVTSIPNFTLLQYREVLYAVFGTASGAPSSTPGVKLLFLFLLFL